VLRVSEHDDLRSDAFESETRPIDEQLFRLLQLPVSDVDIALLELNNNKHLGP
jgi:hypothetical protein